MNKFVVGDIVCVESAVLNRNIFCMIVDVTKDTYKIKTCLNSTFELRIKTLEILYLHPDPKDEHQAKLKFSGNNHEC